MRVCVSEQRQEHGCIIAAAMNDTSRPAADGDNDPQLPTTQEMQARYDRSLASRRMLTVAGRSSSRGTAGSTRTDSSGSPPAAAAAAASAAAAGAGGFVPNPYGSYTWRSSGDDRFKVPTMTEEAAARVTRGFMAVGSVRNVVKAVEHSLFDMGAEVRAVWWR